MIMDYFDEILYGDVLIIIYSLTEYLLSIYETKFLELQGGYLNWSNDIYLHKFGRHKDL